MSKLRRKSSPGYQQQHTNISIHRLRGTEQRLGDAPLHSYPGLWGLFRTGGSLDLVLPHSHPCKEQGVEEATCSHSDPQGSFGTTAVPDQPTGMSIS